MRILMLHNRYQQMGGEDGCFELETDLLRRHGCDVVTFEESNTRIAELGTIRTALRTPWSIESYRAVRKILRHQQFDILHVHNFFPLLTPSVYYAARAEGVPVVQTLHNYRLLCPGGMLIRNDRGCEKCVNRAFPWPGIVHRCYRDSAMATAVVGIMLAGNSAIGTWHRNVDAYIVLTEFMRQKFIDAGFPKEKLYVKPNFLEPDPGLGSGDGNFAFFAGRLAREKGVETLLRAWEQLDGTVHLKIAGTGPMEAAVREAASRIPSVEYIGLQPNAEVIRLMGEASIFVLPTETYEGHPRSAVEAFARGLPLVGSRLGALVEMVEDDRTGILFERGDVQDLVSKVLEAVRHPERLKAIGRAARSAFEAKYTAEKNYAMLTDIYRSAAASRRSAI